MCFSLPFLALGGFSCQGRGWETFLSARLEEIFHITLTEKKRNVMLFPLKMFQEPYEFPTDLISRFGTCFWD